MTEDFSTKKVKWTDDYLVSSYEVDARGRASLTTLCKFMQETAYNHAHHLGFGYVHLKDSGLFWVLSRMLIRIDRYPCWDERIQVQTWPSGTDRLFAYRDFQLLDESGSSIGAAGSGWLMLDMENRRPQRPAEFQRLSEQGHLFPEERSLDRQPERVPPLTDREEGAFFPVRYSDLDLYDHVNNAKYVQWLLDGYPEEMLRGNEPEVFEINYVSESKMGDEAAIYTQKLDVGENHFRHCIKRKSDNKDICLAEIKWRKSS
jgi:medium-chain acyl-[acyl-carrier-protein] hydrolase